MGLGSYAISESWVGYGCCSALAREAVRRQREEALAATDWPHRDGGLELIEAKLPSDG